MSGIATRQLFFRACFVSWQLAHLNHFTELALYARVQRLRVFLQTVVRNTQHCCLIQVHLPSIGLSFFPWFLSFSYLEIPDLRNVADGLTLISPATFKSFLYHDTNYEYDRLNYRLGSAEEHGILPQECIYKDKKHTGIYPQLSQDMYRREEDRD